MLDGHPVRDHFGKIVIDAGQLVIRGLPPGDFQLSHARRTTEISVSSGTAKDGLIVSRTRILPLHLPFNPTIAAASADNDEVRIRIQAAGPNSRVSIVGKRFATWPWDMTGDVRPFSPPIPQPLIPGFTGCGFLTERRISDEMRYILDRRSARTFPGSMLPRPGLLLHRWTEEDLYQDSVAGNDGNSGKSQNAAMRQTYRGAGISGGETHGEAIQLTAVSDFLQFPSVVRFDLKPAADGSLKLPRAQFEGSQFIEIVATDAFTSDTLILPLPSNDTPLRDRRIARPLDPQAHFLATRSAAVLRKDAEASIENLLDADWRAFTTLSEVQEFLYGMNGDDRLREFVFLTEWPTFHEAKKLELLSAHACHEFHLFLARKDKAFFEKHVKPLLAQKPEPTFIDDLLLGRDLNPYLRPYAWQRLNAAEKALLSQALPEACERISREFTLRWQLEAPAPDAETRLFTQTLRGSDLAMKDSLGLAKRDLHPPAENDAYGSSVETNGVAYVAEKLRMIVIPRIDFEDTTVEEAIDFLRLRATELDMMELDPLRKGVNLVIRMPRGAGGASDPARLRIKELRLRNVPLATALKYICDQTNLSYKVDDYAVTIVPRSEGGEDLFSRTFRVPPDFRTAMDPQSPNQPIRELLKRAGIVFPEGASASLSGNGALLVTNTQSELDKIAQLTQTLGAAESPITDAFAAGENEGILPPLDDSVAAADPIVEQAHALEPRAVVPSFPDRTRLWREANYFKNSKPTDESLIPLNRFWLDLAAWDGKGSFLSAHFNACHTTANEALMCLALLDLPFKAERPEVKVDGSSLRVKAREPMVLFYKDTRRTENVAAESPLLVRQTFSPLAEPFRTVNGRQVENPVSGDFRPGVPYRQSLVVTNPTGVGRRIDVLAQIPAGTIPLQGKLATLSSTHELAPYGVVMLELAFYFPTAGDFPVYPLQVSEDATILAATQARILRVSADPAPVDAASWGVLANEGTAAEVLKRLRTENLMTLDLSMIRWRLNDSTFFLE
ncbi:MAG: STN domain-containing protein, partial [Luteolibacter sp.]